MNKIFSTGDNNSWCKDCLCLTHIAYKLCAPLTALCCMIHRCRPCLDHFQWLRFNLANIFQLSRNMLAASRPYQVFDEYMGKFICSRAIRSCAYMWIHSYLSFWKAKLKECVSRFLEKRCEYLKEIGIDWLYFCRLFSKASCLRPQ
jgi:hypothetical protein